MACKCWILSTQRNLNNKESKDRSVFAVVVTFNRPHVLRVCIDSLLTQIEFGLQRIHIIVNSADNETKVLLQNYTNDLITHEFLDNPGPAGGFNIGLQRF